MEKSKHSIPKDFHNVIQTPEYCKENGFFHVTCNISNQTNPEVSFARKSMESEGRLITFFF